MFLIDHLVFLWNGGLDPARSLPAELRERRTLSATIAFAIPVALGLFISNYYTGGERDNLYIALATCVLVVALYVQAYGNKPLLASQLPIFAFWVVMCLAMSTVGVSGNTWAWLLTIPAIAALVSGRVAGVVWAAVCMITLWVFAWQHAHGAAFEFSQELAPAQVYALAFEASLVLLMLSSATYVFRNGQLNAERKLSTAVRDLEREVHDRSLAENEARQSEQSKAGFLAAMSHEIRTPLHGIIGATQLLGQERLSGKKQEWLDVVLKSSETLLEITNNVLDLSQLDSKNLQMEALPVDLRQLLSTTLASDEFKAGEKGLEFTVTVSDEIPAYIKGDSTRLRQIFMNLVGNAVKFTDKGGVTVDVDTALDRMRIRVSDTGIGISKQAQGNLFDPYVQADLATMRKFGGSGLGLTIVKRLVTAMNGKIVVDSVPGQGSTFTVFLPLEEARKPAETVTPRQQIQIPKLNVVVADDNAINLMVLASMLEEDGHHVIPMTNGKDVVEYLPDHKVDMVLMDLQMPVMDGVTAVRKIRAMRGRLATTPVVAVTSNVLREQPQEMLDAGMSAFLAKPFRAEQLREVMLEAMSPNAAGLQ